MIEEIEKDDAVEIAYTSERSGNVVSRTGTVVQVPNGNETTVLFAETANNQLTGVKSDYAFSISVTDEGNATNASRPKRVVPLGPITSVHSK